MGILGKLFGGGRDRRPPPASTTAKPLGTPGQATSQAAKMDRVALAMLMGKRGRYVHMAKHHEMLGELTEADWNYITLASAQEAVLGSDHPDFATALFELAQLNHNHVVEHAPDVQMIYNTLGRGSQVALMYRRALGIRKAALGSNDSALAQSLYGLATALLDSKNAAERAEATVMLEAAAATQKNAPDRLPYSRTLSAMAADALHRSDRKAARRLHEACLQALTEASSGLALMEQAGASIKKAGADPGKNARAVDDAERAHRRFADPYFCMMLELLGPGELRMMALELLREQYRRVFRQTRLEALEDLATLRRQDGDSAGAEALLKEAEDVRQGKLA